MALLCDNVFNGIMMVNQYHGQGTNTLFGEIFNIIGSWMLNTQENRSLDYNVYHL